MSQELRLEYESRDALKSDHALNLQKGRAFIVFSGALSERARCRIVLMCRGSRATFEIDAEVVWVKRDEPSPGVGVAFSGFDEQQRRALQSFVEANDVAPEGGELSEQEEEEVFEHEDAATAERSRGARNVHERVRGLGVREREVMARQGTLAERVALERCYSGSVWESLLQNPQITPPEVARIAKNGGLPAPLVATIVANGAWLNNGEIQRALLGNPRVRGAQIDRVLRALPRGDLGRVASLSAYRAEVRAAAKRLLGV
jgi:hypothetical protein